MVQLIFCVFLILFNNISANVLFAQNINDAILDKKFYSKECYFEAVTFSLKNGLHVICLPKNSLPVMMFSIWYKCGSNDDFISKSGVAHYLEHMVCANNNGEFNKFLEQIGATRNAFTSYNNICFYEIFPAKHLEKIIKNEAQRMEKISIDPKIFASEKGAILEEESYIYKNPYNKLGAHTLANIFHKSNGGISVIGFKHEIEKLTIKDLIDYHQQFFAPNNAIIIIAGNFNLNDVQYLINKYFGCISVKNIHKKKKYFLTNNIKKNITLKSNKVSSLYTKSNIYPVNFSHNNDYRKHLALLLAIHILNLDNHIIKKTLLHNFKIIKSLSFKYFFEYFSQNIFEISYVYTNQSNEENIENILSYLKKKFFLCGFSEEALQIVKKQFLLSSAYKNDNIFDSIWHIGAFLSANFTFDSIEQQLKTIQSISLKECNDVIMEILSQNTIATTSLVPQGFDYNE